MILKCLDKSLHGGGTYTEWQSNVQDVRDFILDRCSTMNNGFIPCYPDLSGPFDVTVEIVGIGEVEMSDNLIINETNSPQVYSRFGGVELPFEVKSGTFQYWEVLPNGTYIYDPILDTLEFELQGNVTVRSSFLYHQLLQEILSTWLNHLELLHLLM